MEYWHNPRCSKSRAGKELLDSAGVSYEERRYLDDPPTAKQLDEVLKALGMEPWDIARMGEDVAKELGLSSLPHGRAKWIEEAHQALANGTLGLIGLHVIGVLVASFEHRENLVKAMVTGTKRRS